MGRRGRIRGYYVERDAKGRLKKWTKIGRSLRADRRRGKPWTKRVKSGYGHRGDVY